MSQGSNSPLTLPILSESKSNLLNRRIQNNEHLQNHLHEESGEFAFKRCDHCSETFSPNEDMLSCQGHLYHKDCFVCAQCFQPFPNEVFFEFDGRKYCEHDFQMLFAPFCAKCDEFITGRVIKAMNLNWHPDCFSCELCGEVLSEIGFKKYLNKALCKECYNREKENLNGRYICFKCKGVIETGFQLKVKGEYYHAYHFNCSKCNVELNNEAREKEGEIYCLRCWDKMVPICAACRRPVEDRVVHAMGKVWHKEHFVCTVCEHPFLGTRYYELFGKAYCNLHYQTQLGNLCARCQRTVQGDGVEFTNKVYCINHFNCMSCDTLLSEKSKIYEIDMRPICKSCLEKLPKSFRKHLAFLHKTERKVK